MHINSKIIITTLVLTLFIYLPVSLAAESDTDRNEPGETHSGELQGWSFAIEQDLFYLIDPNKNEDRNYTMGIDVGWYGEAATHTYLYDSLTSLDSLLGLTKYQQDIQRSMHLGVAVYTPNDLSNPNPIFDDRPYASLIYWTNRTNRVALNGESALATELTIGVLGLNFAKEIQTFTHKLQREISGSDTPEDPRGWDYQISKGGELTFHYRLESNRLLTRTNWYDLSYTVAGDLGYRTGLDAGLLWRAGTRASHFSSFTLRPGQGANLFANAKPKHDNYVYLYYQLSGIIYDELLQGGFRQSTVTFSSDQIERAVHTVALGWTITFDSGSRLTFAQYMHSPEYKGPNRRNHYWGGFYLTFPFTDK